MQEEFIMIKLNGGESVLSNESTKGLLTSIPHGLYPMDETGQELVIGNQLRSFNNTNGEITVEQILSEEETIKRVNEYIKENDIESDDDYIYLYKTTDENLVDLDNSTRKYELNSIHTSECDKNIEKLCGGKGIEVRTLEEAIKRGKRNSYVGYASGFIHNFYSTPTIPIPVNPKILIQYNYRILKVKIQKSDLIITNNQLPTLRTGRIEIIEEVTLEHKITYKTENIIEVFTNINKGYEFHITVTNEMNDESIEVQFTDDIDIAQYDIIRRIQSRLSIMQKIYDKYAESNAELDTTLWF